MHTVYSIEEPQQTGVKKLRVRCPSTKDTVFNSMHLFQRIPSCLDVAVANMYIFFMYVTLTGY